MPAEKAGGPLERVKGLDGVIGLALQRGISLDPPGDVIIIRATNDGARAVLAALDALGGHRWGAILTSEPRSLIARPYQNGIDRESNETIWEEMAFLLRRETNLSANYLALMALSGSVAAVGLWTDTLHIVVGAMVIAPGFEPLLRIPFGLIGGPRALASHGLRSTVAGYLLLALGAALGAVLVPVTPTGALVPALCVAALALASGNLALAGQGLLRWAVEAVVVLLAGGLVLAFKQARVHRRQALG